MSIITDGSLKKIFGDALAPFFDSMDLIKESNSYDSSTAINTITETTYPCKGLVTTLDEKLILNGAVKSSDRRILITQKSLEVEPVPTDRVQTRSKTYVILTVTSDPASAIWDMVARS